MSTKSKTIYLVDDSATYREIGENILKTHYNVLSIPSGEKLITILESQKSRPHLILLDVEMPGLSGFETIERLKADPSTADIPVIFVTSLSDSDDENYGFELGAEDYISKPFSAARLLHRLKMHLQLKDQNKIIADFDKKLNEMVEARFDESRDLGLLHEAIVQWSWELIDRDTTENRHIKRITYCMRHLIEAAKYEGPYIDEVADWDTETVVLASALHDMGKIRLPREIVSKTNLSKEENECFQQHVLYGLELLADLHKDIEEAFSSKSEVARKHAEVFFKHAKAMAYGHHEKWDGSGYPDADERRVVPLEARMMVVINKYDHLVTGCRDGKTNTHQEAMEVIKNLAGKELDPYLVKLFIGISDTIEKFKK